MPFVPVTARFAAGCCRRTATAGRSPPHSAGTRSGRRQVMEQHAHRHHDDGKQHATDNHPAERVRTARPVSCGKGPPAIGCHSGRLSSQKAALRGRPESRSRRCRRHRRCRHCRRHPRRRRPTLGDERRQQVGGHRIQFVLVVARAARRPSCRPSRNWTRFSGQGCRHRSPR